MFIVNSQIFCVQSSIRAAKGNQPLLSYPIFSEYANYINQNALAIYRATDRITRIKTTHRLALTTKLHVDLFKYNAKWWEISRFLLIFFNTSYVKTYICLKIKNVNSF